MSELNRSAKMKAFAFLVILILAGCVLRPENTTVLNALVRSHNELTPLGTPQPERPRYVTELDIVSPTSLDGRRLEISSNRPLPFEHVLRKKGARLKLSVVALESGRGTSIMPAEGLTRIIYQTRIENMHILAEEEPINQSAQPTPGALTLPCAADLKRSSCGRR